MIYYECFCKKCNRKTSHRVFSIRRRSGTKLACSICNNLTPYKNVSKLTEIKSNIFCKRCNKPLNFLEVCGCKERLKWKTIRHPGSLSNGDVRGLN